jgi:hypothetical protein
MPAIAVSPACSAGRCDECRGTVHAGRVSVPCACPHHAPAAVRRALDRRGVNPSRVLRTSDPRQAGGVMVAVGPGKGETVLDTSQAVLVDDLEVCELATADGRVAMAAFIEGRVNHTEDRVGVLYLVDADGAAAFVSEIVGLAARIGPDFEEAFLARLGERSANPDLWPAVPPEPRPEPLVAVLEAAGPVLDLLSCDHPGGGSDPECARCETLGPLRAAVAAARG